MSIFNLIFLLPAFPKIVVKKNPNLCNMESTEDD